VTIRFGIKDAGRDSLVKAVSDILSQETVFSGAPQRITHATGGYIVSCTSRQRTTKGGMFVNIRFNMNHGGRRAFANAVGEILGRDVVYRGTPSFAYAVGDYIVERDGGLTFPNNIFHRESADLIMALRERGYEVETDVLPDFKAETPDDDARSPNELTLVVIPLNAETQEQCELPMQQSDHNRLTIDIPRADFTDAAINNLQKIIASKAALIRKALGIEHLPLIIGEEKLHFPWFTLTGADGEIETYLRFVTALCKMAKESRRITAKERDTDNDKFSMRVFLIRLGFVGPEYKAARKLLLRNLSGNSSWKAGPPPAPPTLPEDTPAP